jgi:hypothetical protein
MIQQRRRWLLDKRILNGELPATFQRNSVAGTELTGWLRRILAKKELV